MNVQHAAESELLGRVAAAAADAGALVLRANANVWECDPAVPLTVMVTIGSLAATVAVAPGGPAAAGPAVAGPTALTAHENRLIGMAVNGRTNREIAEYFGVTRRAVEFHFTQIYRKLGIARRPQLYRFAHAQAA